MKFCNQIDLTIPICFSLVPRLFLIERTWQHLGLGAVYLRYVMIRVIYSDPTQFYLNRIMCTKPKLHC